MTLDRTPLDIRRLSPAAQRALGAGPGRMMAARGLVPLAPSEQVAVLYQLAIDADAALAEAARATAAGLPEKLLAGTLTDTTLDARVLDLFGELALGRPALFEAVVLNPTSADPTIAMMAGRADQREVDLIAQNEQRLLRHPEIIAAMYMNRRARMSTIDRVIELSVRNHVRVPGLAAWDEIARALTGDGATDPKPDRAKPGYDAALDAVLDAAPRDDAVLTRGDAEQPLSEDEQAKLDDTKGLPFRELPVSAKIRAATLGNAFVRAEAIRDPLKMVALAAIKSPGVTEIEAARYAGNQTLAEDVIRYIATRRDWTKLYGVKVSLCRNPKAPITEVTRMLPFLRERDLTALVRSKGIPQAVVQQARKLQMNRGGAGGRR